jgi:hypothetical protein
MKVICPKCGSESEGNFCSKCGTLLQQVYVVKEEPQNPPEVLWTTRCPVCQSGTLDEITQKKLFGMYHITNLVCDRCNAVFVSYGNKYMLTDIKDKLLPIWQKYNKQSLTTEEWKRISYGGMSEANQRENDLEQYMTNLKEGKVSVKLSIQGGSSSIILKEKEELQLMLPNVVLREARSVRTSSGGYAGPSFRVAKGVYFRTGAFSAQSESHDVLKELDRGRLTLTNKRLIFTGAMRSSEITLSKIVAIEPYSDGIVVRASGHSKIQYFIWKELKEITITLTINERSYHEPFTGLMLKYMIEGNINRESIKE